MIIVIQLQTKTVYLKTKPNNYTSVIEIMDLLKKLLSLNLP